MLVSLNLGLASKMLWVGVLVAVLLLASFYYLMFADGNPFKVHLIYYGCLLTRSPPDSLERIRDALQNNPENQVDHMAEYAALALFVPRGQFPIHRHSSSQQEAAKGLLAAWYFLSPVLKGYVVITLCLHR